MARKLRIQFEGAIYHVINRGNYRRDIFATPGAAKAFEVCLYETCERMGWILYAYAIMRNHFHLAVQTPRANLVQGMHWLQTTFAVRFNRLRAENGHLFQARYRAILVERGESLARVVDYIHLNPVRAGIVSPQNIAAFRWGSLRLLARPAIQPFIDRAEWLGNFGLKNDAEGTSTYLEYIRRLGAEPGLTRRERFRDLVAGWAIGTAEWRKDLAERHLHKPLPVSRRSSELRELFEAQWEATLAELLVAADKTKIDVANATRSASWKVDLALQMKRSTEASNAWLATALNMGGPGSVSVYLTRRRAKLRRQEVAV